MPSALTIESLQTETPTIITRVTSGAISLGREPENTIQLESEALSRRHAVIEAAGEEWYVCDLDSSNGTSLNGVPLMPGQLKLLRSGDQLLLADFPLLIKIDAITQRSIAPELIIFNQDGYLQSYSFAAGSSFLIGNANCNLAVPGYDASAPVAKIDSIGSAFTITVPHGHGSVRLDGMEIAGTSELADRAQLVVGPYTILISIPQPERADRIDADWETKVRAKAQAARSRYVFGQMPNNVDGEQDPFAKTSAHGTIGVSRQSAPQIDYSSASNREKLIIFLGILMTLLVVAALVILVFQFV